MRRIITDEVHTYHLHLLMPWEHGRRHHPYFINTRKKPAPWSVLAFQAGDPREIRTPDTLIRSQVLYPAELLGHVAGAEGLKPPTYGFGDRCSINCAMPLSVWWKSSSMWLVYNNKSFRKLQGVFANIFEKRFWCKVQGSQEKGATGPVRAMGWCGA